MIPALYLEQLNAHPRPEDWLLQALCQVPRTLFLEKAPPICAQSDDLMAFPEEGTRLLPLFQMATLLAALAPSRQSQVGLWTCDRGWLQAVLETAQIPSSTLKNQKIDKHTLQHYTHIVFELDCHDHLLWLQQHMVEGTSIVAFENLGDKLSRAYCFKKTLEGQLEKSYLFSSCALKNRLSELMVVS